jgi:hypothetical protein
VLEFFVKSYFEKLPYSILDINGDKITINDSKNLLGLGSDITIYKNIGSVGNNDNVYLPVQDAYIESRNGNTVIAKLDPITKRSKDISVSSGDMIFEQVLKNDSSESKILKVCSDKSQLEGSQLVPDFNDMSRFVVQKNLKYPFYDLKKFASTIKEVIKDGIFEYSSTVTAPSNFSYCIQPVYKVTVDSSSKVSNLVELYNINTISGARILDQANNVITKGDSRKKSKAEIPVNFSNVALKTNFVDTSLETFQVGISSIGEIK